MTGPRNLLLHGTSDPLPEDTVLCAGPLTMIFTEGEIRYVRLGSREVIRRLYVAVRDARWATIPSRVIKVEKEILADSFRIKVQLEHKLGEIDFFWENSIVGEARGRIQFRARGTARSGFLRNRIGLCVLFPGLECQSAPCTVTGLDGQVRASTFPDLILPHQPFRELSGISYEPLRGVHVDLRLCGDTFEMEDQRNWGDASFKVYSTPLELPIPVTVRRGTVVSQSATINVKITKSTDTRQISHRNGATEPITIAFDRDNCSTLPRIGSGLPTPPSSLSDQAAELLSRLNLSHLRVDLWLQSNDFKVRFESAIRQANVLELPLECALYLSENVQAELDLLVELIRNQHPPISTVLVFDSQSLLTTPDYLEKARTSLGPMLPGAMFGGGTDGNFVDLNRSVRSFRQFDLLSFSYNPQVHSTDRHSLVENLDGIRSTIRSAKQFARGIPVAVSPVTLKYRYRLDNSPHPLLRIDGRDPQTDSRLGSLFGASLGLGILKHLAESGVYSATCFQSYGPQGLLPDGGLDSGSVFPLFHVFAAVLSRRAAKVISTRSSAPNRVQSLALEYQGETSLLLGNLSPENQAVELQSPQSSGVRIKSLDESNLMLAMRQPLEFQKLPYSQFSGTPGSLALEIKPWAVTELVWTGLNE